MLKEAIRMEKKLEKTFTYEGTRKRITLNSLSETTRAKREQSKIFTMLKEKKNMGNLYPIKLSFKNEREILSQRKARRICHQ